MANKRSAMKAHRVAERRYARNRPVRSALRTFVKKARVGIASIEGAAAEEATALVAAAAKELDQAASKGIIHKNQAARRKGRLMHQLAVVARTAAETAEAPAPAARPTRRRTATVATAAPAKPRTTRSRTSKAPAPAEPASEKPAPTRTRTRRTQPSS